MGNATWVCFDCREAMRRPTHYRAVVPCPVCGQAGRFLGTRIRIPARDRARSWRRLRLALQEAAAASAETAARIRVRHRHRIEREIAALEARPASRGRNRTIQLLQERLVGM
jgi:hypothetical protein